MVTRNVILLFSLFILLVEGDLDSNDAGIQVLSTDKDSTSDEAPTESMNAISPDHPAPAANQVTAPEPAAVAANSVEEEDEDESSNSEEGGNMKFRSRSAKPQSPAHPPQRPAHIMINQSPTFPSQPIIPQLKALVRNRTAKRRSRTNRRQI